MKMIGAKHPPARIDFAVSKPSRRALSTSSNTTAKSSCGRWWGLDSKSGEKNEQEGSAEQAERASPKPDQLGERQCVAPASRGSERVNVVPASALEVTAIVPPSALTMCRTMKSPSPTLRPLGSTAALPRCIG